MKTFFHILTLISSTAFACQISAETTTKPSIDWRSIESISKHIEIRQDSEHGEITYGPNFSTSDQFLSENFSDIYLMRIVDLEGADHYTIYINARYDDKNFRSYESAVNAQGKAKLPLQVLSKTGGTCSTAICQYEEKLAIPLSFLYFFDGSVSGLSITISGNRSDQIKIPDTYFKAMLNAIQEEKI
tara:strand:+ start:2132 stop:2692 length:561 start_codon:yes stop_codon:yes gene_type:complete